MTKSKFKFYSEHFIFAILAGLMIGIAGTVYLQTNQSLIGTILFSFGLITIIQLQFPLYTGRIGWMSHLKEVKFLPFWIVGNYIGTYIVAILLKLTRYGDQLSHKASIIWDNKLNDSYFSLFILAIFCGIMMYLTLANGVKTSVQADFTRIFLISLPVIIFILCGFEHSIADMFYLNLSKNIFNFKDIKIIFILILGNGVGAQVIPRVQKLFNK